MEIESNLRSINKQRVPVFVVAAHDCMKFYAFHDSMYCPTFDPKIFIKDESVEKLAQPFTGFTSCPVGCAFASVGDQFYLFGGTKQSFHELSELTYDDPIPGESRVSSRVIRFDCQSFVNSLADNKDEGKSELVKLDGNEVSSEYWETCASLSIGRREGYLLHLGGKLYAVGGISRFEKNMDYTNASLIEVFENGVWNPLTTHDPPDIDPYFLISVALEDSNKILIGSKGAFYELNVGTAQWKKLAGVECPNLFVEVCLGKPGLVVRNRYVMWYDHMFLSYGLSIVGLDLCANKHFYVDIPKLLDLKLKHYYLAQSGTIIDMKDEEGSLCFLFHYRRDGQERQTSFDEHHCVTFQIIFDNLAAAENKPFPGVELKTKLISRRKCFTLHDEGMLEAAFATDVCFSKKRICPDTCDIGEAS